MNQFNDDDDPYKWAVFLLWVAMNGKMEIKQKANGVERKGLEKVYIYLEG